MDNYVFLKKEIHLLNKIQKYRSYNYLNFTTDYNILELEKLINDEISLLNNYYPFSTDKSDDEKNRIISKYKEMKVVRIPCCNCSIDKFEFSMVVFSELKDGIDLNNIPFKLTIDDIIFVLKYMSLLKRKH